MAIATLEALMKQMGTMGTTLKAASTTKIALGDDEPPEEGHPATKFDDKAEVPHGPEWEEAAAEQIERHGDLAAGASGVVNPVLDDRDRRPLTLNTTIFEGGDQGLPELKPGDHTPDPGADPDHPASLNKKDKYASMTDPLAILNDLEQISHNIAVKLAADPSLLAEPVRKGNLVKGKTAGAGSNGPPLTGDEEVDALIVAMRQMLPTEKLASKASAAVTAVYQPYVAAGIERAIKLANFVKLAEADPAMAEQALMAEQGGGAPMDPAMMAEQGGGAPMDPAMMSGGGEGMPMDPAAMDGGGGGGGGEQQDIEDLLGAVADVAAQHGVSEEEILTALLQEISGGEGGGGGDMGGGEPSMEVAEDPGAAAAMELPPEASAEKTGSAPRAEGGKLVKTTTKQARSRADLMQDLGKALIEKTLR